MFKCSKMATGNLYLQALQGNMEASAILASQNKIISNEQLQNQLPKKPRRIPFFPHMCYNTGKRTVQSI